MECFQQEFQKVDVDGNGTVSKKELLEFFHAHPLQSVEDVHAWVDRLFEELDSDGSGELEFAEWAAGAMRSIDNISCDALAAAFRALDEDGDGEVSIAELS